MILKQDAGLVAPASGLFLRPQRPSQRWPCSRKQRGVVPVALGLLPDSSPVHTRQSAQSTTVRPFLS
ncbi:hypothetical protein M0657_007660 [Pyricularia oryzae]|nr:hypothetical protein M9X92_007181 [Pyricularia oryzae]KAI7918258.1 hypothetical protein M0657_007660 [Pyricularia oryzae]